MRSEFGQLLHYPGVEMKWCPVDFAMIYIRIRRGQRPHLQFEQFTHVAVEARHVIPDRLPHHRRKESEASLNDFDVDLEHASRQFSLVAMFADPFLVRRRDAPLRLGHRSPRYPLR
jgi:hypothetical protein